MGDAGGDRASAEKRLLRERARACVRLLFPNPPDGLLVHGSSGAATARRFDALHHLADCSVGDYTEADAHAVRAARHSAGIQERISDLVVSPAQAIEGGGRGERV